MASRLPDKIFYKIGEVAEAAGVRTSVLRFWETEFPFIKPAKSGSGQRLYTKNEIDLVLQVRHLLYDQKFTIEGVKKRINPKGKMVQPEDVIKEAVADYTEVLRTVRNELMIIRNLL